MNAIRRFLLALTFALVAIAAPGGEAGDDDARFSVRVAAVQVSTIHDADLDPDDQRSGWRLRAKGLEADSRVAVRIIPRPPLAVIAATEVELVEAVAEDGVALAAATPPPWTRDWQGPVRNPLDADAPEMPLLVFARFQAPAKPVTRIHRLRVRFDVRYADASATSRTTWELADEPVAVLAGGALRLGTIADGGVGIDVVGDADDRLRRIEYLAEDGGPCRGTRRGLMIPPDGGPKRVEAWFDRPAARVAVETFDALRAARIEATFSDIPLTGVGDPIAPPNVTITDLPAPEVPAAAAAPAPPAAPTPPDGF